MTEHVSAADPVSAASRVIERLKKRQDFLAANSGTRVPMPAFVLLVKPAGHGLMRVGYTTSRKVGNAVVRNRARRRLREVARLSMSELGIPSADHVFIARPQQTELPFDELLSMAKKALAKARRRMEQ